MKILNLYAGIGGNRKLWGNDHQITAVEINQDIAKIYKDLYPNDKVIIDDAHDFLIKNYKNYDFIWSSPPCQSHSIVNHFLNAQGVIRYPDLKLYEEILLLKYLYKGKYVIENVKSYYEPLIKPQLIGRHYFWANFKIFKLIEKIDSQIGRLAPNRGLKKNMKKIRTENNNLNQLGFDLSKYNIKNKIKLLKNCVHPKIGKNILDQAFEIYKSNDIKQKTIFE
tara:strand:- start:885 stop:1553 length:669 start_codon:yes stop_codon:yes gene_type:complete